MTDVQLLLTSPKDDLLLELLLIEMTSALQDGDVIFVSNENHQQRVQSYLNDLFLGRDINVVLQIEPLFVA